MRLFEGDTASHPVGAPRGRAGRLVGVLAALVAMSAGSLAAQQLSGGDGFLYVGTYEGTVHIVSERDFSFSGKIAAEAGIPGGLLATSGGTRLVAPTIDYEWVEVFDVPSRRSVNTFTLSERNARVRIQSMAVHPDGRYAVLMTRRYEKLRDRWEIGDMELFVYDMAEHRVVQDVPWPDGRPEENRASFEYTPDGRHFLFFKDEVHVYETETYTEVDTWDYSGMLDEGLGDFRFGFPGSPREEPGWYAGLFRIQEEFQDRSVVGVARANPMERAVEFRLIGPSDIAPTSGFALAPDRTHAYALHQEVGNYQLWSIDLETGAARHVVFPGRPRMSLEVSSNGRFLYIYAAGNTIDVFDAATLEHRHTVELDADMTIGRLWVLPSR